MALLQKRGEQLPHPHTAIASGRVQDDFMAVLARARPTVAPSELLRFEEFTRDFGSSGE